MLYLKSFFVKLNLSFFLLAIFSIVALNVVAMDQNLTENFEVKLQALLQQNQEALQKKQQAELRKSLKKQKRKQTVSKYLPHHVPLIDKTNLPTLVRIKIDNVQLSAHDEVAIKDALTSLRLSTYQRVANDDNTATTTVGKIDVTTLRNAFTINSCTKKTETVNEYLSEDVLIDKTNLPDLVRINVDNEKLNTQDEVAIKNALTNLRLSTYQRAGALTTSTVNEIDVTELKNVLSRETPKKEVPKLNWFQQHPLKFASCVGCCVGLGLLVASPFIQSAAKTWFNKLF